MFLLKQKKWKQKDKSHVVVVVVVVEDMVVENPIVPHSNPIYIYIYCIYM